MKAVLAACVLAAAVAAQARAQQFDNTTLFEKDAWSVLHTYDADSGDAWCSADTSNAGGQMFSIVAYDHGAMAVIIADPNWRLAARDVRFRIDIDYSRWDVGGSGEDQAVFVALNDEDGAADFLGDLMQGGAVAVYNADDRKLATFSLQGSGSAIEAFFGCWSRIDASDPFIAASDPF